MIFTMFFRGKIQRYLREEVSAGDYARWIWRYAFNDAFWDERYAFNDALWAAKQTKRFLIVTENKNNIFTMFFRGKIQRYLWEEVSPGDYAQWRDDSRKRFLTVTEKDINFTMFLEGRYKDTYEKRSAQETIADEKMIAERGF